jgi:alkanesulfonate monooxygenase SsuD/methylene tetrahydromethanopterin reductase-like flavin-dependent oxidoreductase (luciferase family)
MKFALSFLCEQPPWQGQRAALKDAIDQAAYADALGFDAVWIAEHHFSEYGVAPDVAVLAAALLPRVTRMRIGTAVTILPFNHPIRTAESFAMVDVLSDGRLDFGVGRGYQPAEFSGFGVPMEESRARFDEALEVVRRAWTEDRTTFEGRFFTVRDVRVLPKPVQKPHPPILVGGSGKRGTVEPALRFADEYNAPFVTPVEAAAIRTRVQSLRFSVMTGCVIGETHGDALERAQQLYARAHRDADFDTWLARYSERAIVGSVDEVAARLREYEAARCDGVMLQHLLHADLEPVRLIAQLSGEVLRISPD